MVVSSGLSFCKLSQAVLHVREPTLVTACLHGCARRALTQGQSKPRNFSASAMVSNVGTSDSAAKVSMTTDTAPPGPKLLKRRLALFVAYIGSAFRGLQFQRDHAGGTVEDVLQEALHAAGCILPSNFGQLHKIGWKRSSRTDKGVHALANVVSMKLECDPESFTNDPEGVQLTSRINENLPAEVRVLSVQRVNGGFDARGYCTNRTYHYYLPASILGLTMTGDAEDKARMSLLRQCCDLFQGNHPFHNYTKRRLYRVPTAVADTGIKTCFQAFSAADELASRETDAAAHQQQSADLQDPSQQGAASLQEQGDDDDPGSFPSNEASGTDMTETADAAASDRLEASTSMANAETASAAIPVQPVPRPLQFRWLDDVDPRDRLAPAHYRYIKDIHVEDPKPLGSGSSAAVKVSITGTSFMLHQIRHMVGAAVAVARRDLPLEYVSASLCAPARTLLPLAPAQVLVLASSTFQPFPMDAKQGPSIIHSVSGKQLQLGPNGQAARDVFASEVLEPAMEGLLQHEAWGWFDQSLKRISWQADAMNALAQKANAWQSQRKAVSIAKQARLSKDAQDDDSRGSHDT